MESTFFDRNRNPISESVYEQEVRERIVSLNSRNSDRDMFNVDRVWLERLLAERDRLRDALADAKGMIEVEREAGRIARDKAIHQYAEAKQAHVGIANLTEAYYNK